MADIPGWAYTIIGVIIAVMSKIIEARTQPGQFKLFFWIGLVFIAVGIFKMMMKYVFNREKKPSRPELNPYPYQHQQRQAQARQGQQASTAHHAHKNQGPQHHAAQPPHMMHHMQGNHGVSAATQNQMRSAESSILTCTKCGARHYDFANFCMRCGNRLK